MYKTRAPAASMASRTSGAWWGRRLSSTTTSPGYSLGASSSRTYATKATRFIAPLMVRWQSTRSFLIAPTTVMFPPQFAGLSSQTRCPAGARPYEGVMAKLHPDSSMKTSRSGSIFETSARNVRRLAWTSGRCCSEAEKDFFFASGRRGREPDTCSMS